MDHETPDCLGVFYKYINVVIYFNIPILKKRNLDNITIFVFPKYLIWTVFIPNTFVKFGCASGCSEPPVTPSPSNNSIFFSVLLLMHAANINCQIAYKIFMQCFNLYWNWYNNHLFSVPHCTPETNQRSQHFGASAPGACRRLCLVQLSCGPSDERGFEPHQTWVQQHDSDMGACGDGCYIRESLKVF